MPKKKGTKKISNNDFTINDCANAPKPVSRVKKAAQIDPAPELPSWDQQDYDILDVEINEDGVQTLVYRKKRNNSKTEVPIDERPGIVYPEIVWYLISQYIKPEDIGPFAGINTTTYALTKRESFWRNIYKRYCENHPRLPDRLRIENSYKVYGLRQRIIRALYNTYKLFYTRIMHAATLDSNPHKLVKRRCVNMWYKKGPSNWSIYFKFKKIYPLRILVKEESGFIEELGKIDANPEEDSQVLELTCQSLYEVPPVMGMTLSSLSVVLSKGFVHKRLHLGFNRSHNVSKDILPECTVILDTVVNMTVYDWWHPRYPHFDNRLPSRIVGEEALPILKKDFFDMNLNVI